MLVLSRKKDQKIVIGDSITLMVVEIRPDRVRLGFEAPRDMDIRREEIHRQIAQARAESPAPDTSDGPETGDSGS